jgi:hypothetical protein
VYVTLELVCSVLAQVPVDGGVVSRADRKVAHQ